MTTDKPTRPSLEEVEAQLAAQERRRERARMGAYVQHARHDGKAVAARTMAARLRGYELQVDPTGELKRQDPQAVAKRVEAAIAADMAKARLARADKRARAAAAKVSAQARERHQSEAARTAAREAIVEKILRTPPDDLEQLATLILALQATQEQPF